MESLEKHVKKISEIIDKEYNLYKEVFQLVKDEQSVLINADLDSLTANLRKQQVMMDKINKLEEKRLQELEVIAIYLGTTPETLKISFIASKAPDDHGKELVEKERRFKSLIEEILKLNQSNQFLITNSLQFLDKNIQVFFGAIDNSKGIYKNPKTKSVTKAPQKRLLNRIV